MGPRGNPGGLFGENGNVHNGLYTGYSDNWGHGGATDELKLLRKQFEDLQKALLDKKDQGTLTTDDLRKYQAKLEEMTEKIGEVGAGSSRFAGAVDAATAAFSGDIMGTIDGLKNAGVNISDGFIAGAGKVVAGLQLASNIIGGVADTILAATSQFDSAIQQGVENFVKYTGKINARLYGLSDGLGELTDYYGEFAKDVTAALQNNSYVYQEDVLNNIAALVEKGVGYNVESRAYLQTLTEKTVTTFDALDNTLLKSIRMYGMDVTAPMMGAESLVTQLLNGLFADSSYLTDQYDTIYAAVYDANSQLTSSESVTWSLAVQSWLGSLYSVGVSDSTISALAQGLNYLGTGDVTALSGNTALQTIFAMAAANAGLSYGDILLNGLDVETTDELMKAIVDQLQDISANTSNEVVKKAWTEVLGVSISDLTAIERLTESDIATISNFVKDTTYEDTITELQNQVETYLVDESRTTLSERIQNTMDNMMYSVGSTIASDPTMYQTWAQAQFILGLAENLPFDILDLGKNITKLVEAENIEGVINDAIGIVSQYQYGIPMTADALESQQNEFSDLYQEWLAYYETVKGWNTADTAYVQFLKSKGYGDESYTGIENVWSYLKNYYTSLFTEMGSDNQAGLWAFFSDAYNNGGSIKQQGTALTDAALIGADIAAGAIQSISSSMSATSATGSASSLTKLANAEASGETTVVQGAEATATYDIQDVYEFLTDDTKYIRVKLVDVDDNAVDQLGVNEIKSYLFSMSNGNVYSTIQNMRTM